MEVAPLSVETKVQAVLETHGLMEHVSQDEFDVFVRMYSHIRAAADSLYIPELELEEIALLFDPAK